MATFTASMDGSSRERNEATEKFQEDLNAFVKAYPKSEHAADALMQLALYSEVNATSDRDREKAVEYYEEVIARFGDTKAGARAQGAKVRLTCIGKELNFTGSTPSKQKFDLSNKALRGRVVVIHYWTTSCETCVADFDELLRLKSKYKGDLVIVGANLDEELPKMEAFLKKNDKFDWPQLYAEGGTFGSELAIQLGITTLPLTLLIDQDGKVVETGVVVSELDRDIQNLLDK
ncbi:MAG: redoxin family protein [Pirellulaceae bacterium]